MSNITYKLAFIGGGNMAEAILRGLLSGEHASYSAEQIIVLERDTVRQIYISETFGVTVSENNVDACKAATILICVKPQVMSHVLEDIGGSVHAEHLVISIAAGVTLDTLRAGLDGHMRIIRVMPNTPALVGSGAAGIVVEPETDFDDLAMAKSLFDAVGTSVEISDEKLIDAVTGLSGSGPAFVFQIIESMADAGVYAGLPRTTAQRLAAHTLIGSAELVLASGEHPGALKDKVSSPGGTTIAGIRAAEAAGLRHAVFEAVTAAIDKAKALSGGGS